MAATKKVEAGKLKIKHKFKIPAQLVEILHVKEVDLPSLESNLLVLTVKGLKGPYKGVITEIHAWSGDKVEKVLKEPPFIRAWDFIARLWRRPKPAT